MSKKLWAMCTIRNGNGMAIDLSVLRHPVALAILQWCLAHFAAKQLHKRASIGKAAAL